jgi:ATP-dependent RNA helicase DOB1
VRNYRGFTLDDFQVRAIELVEQGQSVLISAPTGAGKTLIADFAVERTLLRRKRCIYTSPLKALSNQKYRDFCRMLGPENVGIMTGDVVIGIDAPLLIMTTEVLRNILHRDMGRVSQVEYVIFDELHYLANDERGTVWEECLILLPPKINIVGLSATVKNVNELAEWLSEIKHRPVEAVINLKRPVPLEIVGFTRETSLTDNETIEKYRQRKLKKLPPRPESDSRHDDGFRRRVGRLSAIFQETTHKDIIRTIAPDYLPCLYFVFRRIGCENYAMELDMDLTDRQEKKAIRALMQPVLEAHGNYEATVKLCNVLERGIGFHHAGLFPFLKELVETLYEQKLIKVLYCTSTFALGVNMPAKTAVFDRLIKFDGTKLRPLTAMEFFQKAGRAGRRGMDRVGYVIVNRNLRTDEGWIPYNEKDIEPIISALNLSYNSIVNLLEKYSIEEIKQLLGDSLWTFQHRNEIEQQEEFSQFVMSDLAGVKGVTINSDSESVEKKRTALAQEIERLERKRSELRNAILSSSSRNRENSIYRELDKLEKRYKDVADSKKNIEVMGFVLEGQGRVRPGRRVMKLFSKIRRAKEKIQYYRDYLFNVFQSKVQVLIALGFIDTDLQLMSRAEVCKYLYIQELFLTRLVVDNVIEELDVLQLNALLNCIGQSERRRDSRQRKEISHPFDGKLLRKIRRLQDELRETGAERFDPIEFNLHYAQVAYLWSKGFTFTQITRLTELQEGDIISSFRQTIDMLKQLKDVYRNDPTMLAKLNTCIDCMDRDVVKVII